VRFMKMPHKCLSLALMILWGEIASGQGFMNLGFENTTLTGVLVNSDSGYYDTNATIPGWDWSPHANAGYSDPNTTVAFNDITLDSSGVTLHGTNDPTGFQALRGRYSILLQGGSQFVSSSSYASIGQTGQVPSSAESITYWGGALQVTFNGQPLTFNAMSNAPTFSVWVADISAYAGQTGLLLFTAPWQTTAMLDNIQFSTSPAPEPGTLSLIIYGSLYVCYRVTRQKRG